MITGEAKRIKRGVCCTDRPTCHLKVRQSHEVDAMSVVFGVTPNYLFGYEPIETAEPLDDEIPASTEAGITGLVAGAGFEPATSGL